jgi:hypothetical protein
MRLTLILSLAAGCRGFGNLPDQGYDESTALWDPDAAWPVEEGLYVSLPRASTVALLGLDGRASAVELESGHVVSIHAVPDGATLVLLVQDTVCVEQTDDGCERFDDLQYLDIVRGGRVEKRVDVGAGWNSVHFTPDSTRAVLRIDAALLDEISAVLDLTSVLVVDLGTGEASPVSVGFAPEDMLFTSLPDGASDRAVVLSKNQVAVVDLLAAPPSALVTFPLAVDPDDEVVPVDVELTGDGSHALIAVVGASDLYVLDLENHSINLVELSGVPSAFANFETIDVAEPDYSVIVFRQKAVVDIVDDALFDTRSIDLDEAMQHVWCGSSFAILWGSDSGREVVRLDPVTGDTVEYRLQNPARSLFVSPGEEYALVLTDPSYSGDLFGSNPGLEVLDLRGDDAQPFLLEGAGLGVAFAATETGLHALVLQERVDYVFELDLRGALPAELPLSDQPVAIGSLSDARFYVTHPSPLGLVSFLDPATGEVVEVNGFAALDILDPFVDAPDTGIRYDNTYDY